MDEQSNICRACNGNPKIRYADCVYCEKREDYILEHFDEDDDIL